MRGDVSLCYLSDCPVPSLPRLAPRLVWLVCRDGRWMCLAVRRSAMARGVAGRTGLDSFLGSGQVGRSHQYHQQMDRHDFKWQ